MGGCGNVQVNLYSQSIDVVEKYCDGALNYAGTGTEPPSPATTRPAPVSETKTPAPTPPSTGSSTGTSTAGPTIYPQPTATAAPTSTSTSPTTTSPPREDTSSQTADNSQPTEAVGSAENRTTVSNANATATASPSPTATKSSSGYTSMSALSVLVVIWHSPVLSALSAAMKRPHDGLEHVSLRRYWGWMPKYDGLALAVGIRTLPTARHWVASVLLSTGWSLAISQAAPSTPRSSVRAKGTRRRLFILTNRAVERWIGE